MACPFIDEVVDEGAIIVRRSFQREQTFRDRLLSPHIANNTCRNRAFIVRQMVCTALRFFVSGTFLYTVGDISKASVCRSV
ncbi:hypothetical protein QQF64_004531 [Cirrhinus molitorella]|uniref:Uncharacterized protein n=1 Tax=Cirrhinus molitorella TaxID=172907 RepID=A0ABR3MIL0_9TELE